MKPKPEKEERAKTLTELAIQIYNTPLRDLTPMQRQDLEESIAAEYKLKHMKIDERIRLLLAGILHLKTHEDMRDSEK